MSRIQKWSLGIVLLALGTTGVALVVQPLDAMPPGTWVASADWWVCDQSSAATECAEWLTGDGVSYMECCVPPSALGTSDQSACTDGGRTRFRPEL